jgi:hypothetical protein
MDDRQILDDYVLWSNREPDMSIDAFLAERKAEDDARRVEEAASQVGIYIFNWGQDGADTIDAIDAMRRISSILIDDRRTIDDRKLTDLERRIRLA